MRARLVTAVRLLLGAAYVVGGLNWFVKLIDPYPSIVDYLHSAPPPDLVGALIQTAGLFYVVKLVEFGAGICLLANRFVPLALVISAPVTVVVAWVDVLFHHHLRSSLMGVGSLTMHGFLLMSYLGVYLPMLAARAGPDAAPAAGPADHPMFALSRAIGMPLGVLALGLGVVEVGWQWVMIAQRALRLAHGGG
jgi:uncharacterized membrane protein YphA (DoxX/SURF4 family)